MVQRLLIACLLSAASLLPAQARPTATRSLDLQAGGGVVSANAGSPYNIDRFRGVFGFVDLDLARNLGAEIEVHQLYSPGTDQVNERTYELGIRYHRTYGRFVPFAKAMYGRGVFNFPASQANLAFNLAAAGAGLDYRLTRRVNLRAEYEYQRWFSFPSGNISPALVSLGAAWHF